MATGITVANTLVYYGSNTNTYPSTSNSVGPNHRMARKEYTSKRLVYPALLELYPLSLFWVLHKHQVQLPLLQALDHVMQRLAQYGQRL